MNALTPSELMEMQSQHTVILIDVREKGEFEAASIKGAINIPLSTFDVDSLPVDTTSPVVFICAIGQRSEVAMRAAAAKHDPERLYNLVGGMRLWMVGGRDVTSSI